VRTLWLLLAGLAVFAFIRRGVQAVNEGYRTSATVLELEADLEALRREHDELQGRLQSLGTDEGKRQEAAHQSKLVKPGEHLLVMRDDEETRKAMAQFDTVQSRAKEPTAVVERLVRSPRKPQSGSE
jgi:hypothetical protein